VCGDAPAVPSSRRKAATSASHSALISPSTMRSGSPGVPASLPPQGDQLPM
jgi:hypothetical protein